MLTVYGIETFRTDILFIPRTVATVLTVYGIETLNTVVNNISNRYELQQCLPFTVLKPVTKHSWMLWTTTVATVLTVYGIETLSYSNFKESISFGRCNSAYRLRY